MSDTSAAGGNHTHHRLIGQHGRGPNTNLVVIAELASAEPLGAATPNVAEVVEAPAVGEPAPPSQTSRSEACLENSSPPQQPQPQCETLITSPFRALQAPFAVRTGKSRHSLNADSSSRSESISDEQQQSQSQSPPPQQLPSAPRMSFVVRVPGCVNVEEVASNRSNWGKLCEAIAAEAASAAAAGAGVIGVEAPRADSLHGGTTGLLLQMQPTDVSGFQDEEDNLQRLSASEVFCVEQQTDPRFTLLHCVALLGCTTLTDALADFRRAHHHQFARLAEYLVKERQHEVYVVDKYGCTPLQLAAACGNTKMVRVLLEPYKLPLHSERALPSTDNLHAYLNHQDHQIRFTALHGAVSHEQHDVVILLLKNGANPSVLDFMQEAAFDVVPSMASLHEMLKRMLREDMGEVPCAVTVRIMAKLLMHERVANKKSRKTEGPERVSALAMGLMEGVSLVIQRYFKQLYGEERNGGWGVIHKYLRASIDGNHRQLAEVMIDVITTHTPLVLLEPRCWKETLWQLVSSFPKLFHYLLHKLQDLRDEDVRVFVRCAGAGCTFSKTYERLVEGLNGVNYRIIKAFFEEANHDLLYDMAQSPIFADFVGLLENVDVTKAAEYSDSSRQLLIRVLQRYCTSGEQQQQQPQEHGSPAAIVASNVFRHARLAWAAVSGASEQNGHGHDPSSKDDDSWPSRLLQTLDVWGVLKSALGAGRADNVEATVESIVCWVDAHRSSNKAVFLAGISSYLIKDLATRFPVACNVLLNLVSKDVLEELDTIQVPAVLMNGRDHVIKCSHVRNRFVWREQLLCKLRRVEGYDDHVVDALVDYGVPFECVYKAAVEMGGFMNKLATPGHFAALISHGFTGPELKQLISNEIGLDKVIKHIEECAKPPPAGVPPEICDLLLEVPMAVLLRDMLRERLDPRIVDVILLEERMCETTRYKCPTTFYPEPLFVPRYTHHFAQLFLIYWRHGSFFLLRGSIADPWNEGVIDDTFGQNDPLNLRLKSAYNKKVTSTQVFILEDIGSGLALEQKREWESQKIHVEHDDRVRHARHLLSIFMSNPLLLHRWPVWAAARAGLALQSAVWWSWQIWQRLEDFHFWENARRVRHGVDRANNSRYSRIAGTIDAAVLVYPLLNFFQLGREDMLTALVEANAPSSWFDLAVVRALYTVRWGVFGRVMVGLSAAVQVQFAVVFLVFFLITLSCRAGDESNDSTVEPLSHKPCVVIVLAVAVTLSASMLLERVLETSVPHLATWVSFGRHLELACHAMVWIVAFLVWTNRGANLVPALSGLTMLLFMARLTLFGLATNKLSTAVLALLEILSDSKYFFLLIAMVYGGFVLAVAGLRQETERNPRIYTSQLFTVLLGDFQSSQLTEEDTVWRFPGVSLVVLSVYAIIMLIIFMNLLIATMNDTYDRVKEFYEVEVMRLRAHMMVFPKEFMARNAAEQRLAPLDGKVLHLLLRPEALKSGRLLALGSVGPASDQSAWVGRISYMRSTIVREVSETVGQRSDKQLAAIEARLKAAQATTAEQLERRMAGLEAGLGKEQEAMKAHLGAISKQSERLARKVATESVGATAAVGGGAARALSGAQR